MALPIITFTPTPAVETVESPHIAYPFSFESDGSLAVVQEGSAEEVAASVANIAVCPQGYRLDLPGFGIPDPTFATLPIDTSGIKSAIEQWEPRASVTVDATDSDPSQPWEQTVTVNVEIDSE